MKKRWIVLLTLAAMLCVALMPNLAMASEEQITLTFAYWGNAEEIAIKEKLAQMYMDAHPNVTIEGTYTDGGEYPTKLQTWFASNTAPDIMGMANDILSPFRDLGVFTDLRPYMERDGVYEDTWNPKALEILSNPDGSIFVAPFVYKIPGIVYNKALFDEAGLPYPTDDWTEDQMREYAVALTSGTGRNAKYGIFLGGWPNQFSRNLYGNPVYDVENRTIHAVDNPEYKAAFSYFVDLVGNLKVAPDDTMTDAIGGGFETGIFGMAITAPWDMANFAKTIGDRFEWDIVQLPTSEAFGHWQGVLFADGWTMSANTAHPEEAWDFIKFMCTDLEAQKVAAPVGVPMLTSYAESDDYLKEYFGNAPYNKEVFVDMLDYATGWETVGIWGKINEELGNQYKLCITGAQDVDTAMQNIQKNGEAILAE